MHARGQDWSVPVVQTPQSKASSSRCTAGTPATRRPASLFASSVYDTSGKVVFVLVTLFLADLRMEYICRRTPFHRSTAHHSPVPRRVASAPSAGIGQCDPLPQCRSGAMAFPASQRRRVEQARRRGRDSQANEVHRKRGRASVPAVADAVAVPSAALLTRCALFCVPPQPSRRNGRLSWPLLLRPTHRQCAPHNSSAASPSTRTTSITCRRCRTRTQSRSCCDHGSTSTPNPASRDSSTRPDVNLNCSCAQGRSRCLSIMCREARHGSM